ncbi:MAG: M20/M25/M40 family metallo-hydrolase [Parasphingorhabdus sp.]|nr:M20/M25/M40 family metallo-hydrolase [Parasphingorhabdus sp.]
MCNGAVDNASGIALLIAVARRLAQQPQLDRDVYFLATTAEESGLLGARAFVADPPLKLSDIVAAFNADTVALNPDGATVSVIGRDGSAFDSEIAVVAAANGRTIDDSGTGDAYAARQDGAVLAAAGVPTRMITSAFADRFILDTFLNGRYHQADDDVEQGVELRGAAMDADFYVALGRHFGRLSSHPKP